MYHYLFKNKFICLLSVVFLCCSSIFSQEFALRDSLPSDSIVYPKDSIALPTKKSAIDATITYLATDSIVLFSTGKGYLYGSGVVTYKNIELQAEYIEMDMDSSQVYASGVIDSAGVLVGNPVFKEGNDTYESHKIRYNFETKKGFINRVITQQGEGFVVSELTKKTADNMLFMKDGRYTTCDNHDHPHFYLNLTRAKVKPKSYIVTGPAYLVVADVPLPIALPFGYFPFTESYSSGLIMPSYGDELTRGFFLRDGGYYFALSDYFDFALTGDIYTKGSWALKGASSYVKRYRYRGNFSTSYMVTVLGERDLKVVGEYAKSIDFSLNWRHTQDAKANPFRTLSADVRYATSSYQRNNVSTFYTGTMESTRSSSINLTQRFPGSPWSISANLSVNQRTRDSIINLNTPDLSFNMSRVYPFKRKTVVGKEYWYEKIFINYSGNFRNSITTKENMLLQSSLTNDWQNGFRHNVPISASFNMLKYITISPFFNYNARWYFNSIRRDWDVDLQRSVVTDTINGFNWLHDFNYGINVQTKIYGFFKPLPALFGSKINMIRWVATPVVGFSMQPDFGSEFFGYWNTYQIVYPDGSTEKGFYTPFERGIFGYPGQGKSGSINFSLSNNLEMKVKSKRDSVGLRKVSLIDNLSLSSSYNLMADSLNLSNINANLRLKFTDRFGLSLSGAFDPYEYRIVHNSTRKINQFRWNHPTGNLFRRMPQLISTSTSFGYSFNNDLFKKKNGDNNKTQTPTIAETEDETETERNNSFLNTPKEKTEITDDGYTKFSMPWNLRFDYSLRYGRKLGIDGFNIKRQEFDMEFSHNVSFSGDVALTPNWRISAMMSYDITNDLITHTNVNITRDLHCWSMTASIVPIGYFTSYMFTIRVKSTLLQDLKYEQRSNSAENIW